MRQKYFEKKKFLCFDLNDSTVIFQAFFDMKNSNKAKLSIFICFYHLDKLLLNPTKFCTGYKKKAEKCQTVLF